MHRRKVLCTFGTLPLLSGCSALSQNESQQQEQQAAIGSVGIRNHDNRKHQVVVEIFDGDEQVYQKTTEVEAASGDKMGAEVVAKNRFIDTKSAYTIRATVDGDEQGVLDPIGSDGLECYVALVRIGADGGPSMGYIPDGYECKNTD